MNNSWLCTYGCWLLENESCFRSSLPSIYQHISLMHMRADIQGHDNSLHLNYCLHPSLALLTECKTQRTVPSAGDASHTLSPHPSPLAFFSSFVLFPSPCFPLWFSMSPLGSSRCTWGAMEGLCQEPEWSLYRLTFNAPPVPPCARKTSIITVMIYSPPMVTAPRQTRGLQRPPGGLWCSISIPPPPPLNPPTPTSCHTRSP